jgi:hypothetical protein
MDIFRLLMDEKELVGGIYPLKRYNWDRLKPPANEKDHSNIDQWLHRKNSSALKTMFDDEAMIQCNLVNYNLNYLHNQVQVENGLIRVKHMATGFMMIARGCLEKMMRSFPSTKYTDDVGFLQGDENKYAYALFDCGVVDDHYLSEDWMFCNRWIQMGGDVFYDIHVCLTHTGPEDYRGAYLASLPLNVPPLPPRA